MHYFHHFLSVGVAHLVVLACVLRATTKKVLNLEKVENFGYAYELAHPWKKSCGRPCLPYLHSVQLYCCITGARSAVAEMAAPCCTSQIFAFECDYLPVFNAVWTRIHVCPRQYGPNFNHCDRDVRNWPQNSGIR